ncbi:hypothetical protein QVD17_04156 [Tagetes erecta]|uniref:Uncharacterized protein n=1 Tax=Tagetes erecta TaxID=13708 RepID=A0AAD8P9I7_TARER|nr:hypothetical protein QVD17_04156 [Tagetes erecta]
MGFISRRGFSPGLIRRTALDHRRGECKDARGRGANLAGELAERVDVRDEMEVGRGRWRVSYLVGRGGGEKLSRELACYHSLLPNVILICLKIKYFFAISNKFKNRNTYTIQKKHKILR